MKGRIVINRKNYNIKVKQSIDTFEKCFKTCLLPSVVDISGAAIKRTVVINQEKLQQKNEKKV